MLVLKIDDIGIGFSYEKIKKGNDNILLEPEWLLNAIYTILFYGAKSANNGVLSHETIRKLLLQHGCDYTKKSNKEESDKDCPIVIERKDTEEEPLGYILSIIRYYRLSYKIQEDKDFFPMLCDRNENISAWNENSKNSLHMILRYEYKPLDVFHKLIVEMYSELDIENVWDSGALMIHD